MTNPYCIIRFRQNLGYANTLGLTWFILVGTEQKRRGKRTLIKKVLHGLIIMTLVVSLTAGCSNSGAQKETAADSTQGTTVLFAPTEPAVRQPSLQVLADAFAAVGIKDWDGSYKNFTFEQRTALEQYFANERGENVRFTDEGVLYEDENKVELSGTWVENSILNAAPEPDFGNVFTSRVEQDSVSVSYTEVPDEKIKAYIEQVKAAGFNHISAEQTTVCCGLAFEADNGNGIKVALASKFAGTQPVTTVTVSIL